MSVQEMKEMRGPSLGQEDPLEDEMATHPRILAWRIPWTEEPDRLQSMGLQGSDTTEQLHQHHQPEPHRMTQRGGWAGRREA